MRTDGNQLALGIFKAKETEDKICGRESIVTVWFVQRGTAFVIKK